MGCKIQYLELAAAPQEIQETQRGAIALYFPQGALPHPPHPPPGQTTEGTQHSDMPGPINLITCVFSYRLRSWSSIVFKFFFFIILTS